MQRERSNYRAVERDLFFIHHKLEGACGLRSSFSSFLTRAFGVEPVIIHPDEHMTDDVMSAVRTGNHIRRTLNALDATHRRTLDATYNPEYQRRYPSPLVIIFGQKLGAVLVATHLPLKELLDLANKKIKRKLTEPEEQQLFIIRDNGQKLYDASHLAYLEIKCRFKR